MKYLLRDISNFQKMTLRRSLILVAALLCFGVFLGFCIQESGKIIIILTIFLKNFYLITDIHVSSERKEIQSNCNILILLNFCICSSYIRKVTRL